MALESGNKDSLQIWAIDSRMQFMFRQLCLFNKVPFISRHQALWREFFTAVVIAYARDARSDNSAAFIYVLCLFVLQNGVGG